MQILYFSLAVDCEDPILGFTSHWIRALAERAEFVHVITMRTGRVDVPINVRIYSVGKERGYSEARRAFEFYKILIRVLRKDQIDICFAHMMPLFTVLAAPFLRARRIPIVTWYAHPSLTWILRLAHHFSRNMLASVTTAYPYKRDKLIAIGQGIDTKLFSPNVEVPLDEPPILLCVGRLSAVKDIPTLLRATALLRQTWKQPFRVVLVGGAGSPRDESHVRALHEQINRLGIENIVHFEPPVAMDKLPFWYRRCAVYVNMTPTGSGDKVAWEAMSCGSPCIAANEGFRETLGKYAERLLFPYGDAESLAARLHWALSLSESERGQLEHYLRAQVVSGHSLNGLATKLIGLFAQLIEKDSGNLVTTSETMP